VSGAQRREGIEEFDARIKDGIYFISTRWIATAMKSCYWASASGSTQ